MAEYRPKGREEITRNMGAIRSTGNRTETALRKELHRMGLRYRKYVPGLPGRPDIVFPNGKVAVFVDGDYWHGRVLRERGLEALEERLKTPNRAYWLSKMQRNVARDDEATRALEELGWTVIRFWEGDIKKEITQAAERVAAVVRQRRSGASASRRAPSVRNEGRSPAPPSSPGSQ